MTGSPDMTKPVIPLLSVEDLRVTYGAGEVLHGISLSVAPGSIATVVGPNGAGKSTLLKAVLGLMPPVSGTIRLNGQDLRTVAPEDRVAMGLSLVPEQRELFTSMTVEENLQMGAASRYRLGAKRMIMEDIEGVYQHFPRLKERHRQVAGTLSGGERQMLALGRALMAKPKLLLLDEPSLGLAPKIVSEIFRMIMTLCSGGVSILLVEQNARAALRVSNYAYVLESGSILMEGESKALAAEERVIDAYLGLSGAAEEDRTLVANGDKAH